MNKIFIFLLIIFPYFSNSVTFDEATKLQDIQTFESERLIMKITDENKDYILLYKILVKNVSTPGYFSYLFQDDIKITNDIMEQYVEEKLNINSDFLEDFYQQKSCDELYYIVYLKETDTVIGSFQIFDSGEDITIGFFIDSAYSGKGFATEATKRALDLIKQHTAHPSVTMDCFEQNVASVKIAQSCGFDFEQEKHLDKGLLKFYRHTFNRNP